MSKWHLIIDVARCENCCNCFLAIKDEYCGNSFPGYSAEQPRHGHRWLDIKQTERGSGSLMDVAYLPITCNQCAEPSCLAAAENEAVRVRGGRDRHDRSRARATGSASWSRHAPTATSGTTRRRICPRSGASTPICWTVAGPGPAPARSAPPAPCSS